MWWSFLIGLVVGMGIGLVTYSMLQMLRRPVPPSEDRLWNLRMTRASELGRMQ